MATKTTKKTTKRAKPRHLYRNAATAAARPPRAIAVSPRGPIASDVEAREETVGSSGWAAIKAAGGAIASTVAGAYLAQQDWVPPKLMTGLIAGLGAVVALEGPEKWKSLGIGAMSAAGGQLGFMLIDDQLIKSAQDKDKSGPVVSKPAPPASGKRQASDIPQDALARAYERARLRMAMTSEPSN